MIRPRTTNLQPFGLVCVCSYLDLSISHCLILTTNTGFSVSCCNSSTTATLWFPGGTDRRWPRTPPPMSPKHNSWMTKSWVITAPISLSLSVLFLSIFTTAILLLINNKRQPTAAKTSIANSWQKMSLLKQVSSTRAPASHTSITERGSNTKIRLGEAHLCTTPKHFWKLCIISFPHLLYLSIHFLLSSQVTRVHTGDTAPTLENFHFNQYS